MNSPICVLNNVSECSTKELGPESELLVSKSSSTTTIDVFQLFVDVYYVVIVICLFRSKLRKWELCDKLVRRRTSTLSMEKLFLEQKSWIWWNRLDSPDLIPITLLNRERSMSWPLLRILIGLLKLFNLFPFLIQIEASERSSWNESLRWAKGGKYQNSQRNKYANYKKIEIIDTFQLIRPRKLKNCWNTLTIDWKPWKKRRKIWKSIRNGTKPWDLSNIPSVTRKSTIRRRSWKSWLINVKSWIPDRTRWVYQFLNHFYSYFVKDLKLKMFISNV